MKNFRIKGLNKSLTLFAYLLFFAISIFAQKPKKLFYEGIKYMDMEDYQTALPYFLKLDSMGISNANIKFHIGLCYLNAPYKKERAIPYLELASEKTNPRYREEFYGEKKAPLLVYKFLGQAYHVGYKFDEAIKNYEKLKDIIQDFNPELTAELNHLINVSNTAKQMIKNPINIEIINLGENINTSAPEYAPVISADEKTLIFTTRRKENVGSQNAPDGLPFEDIYISYFENGKWTKAQSIGDNINTPGHEASIGLSVDGQTLYIYIDDYGDGNIYESKLKGDSWSKPVKLSDNVNTRNWEPSASISSDGKYLYFTSDRGDGLGGSDIWVSKKLPNGDWSLPTNLGPSINTPFDEDGPFIHPDGKTLYFSSKGHNTMGGYDIFYSVRDDKGEWSKPVNIGYPVNTTDDDVFFVLSPDGKRGYYSSFNEKGYGEKDIYMINFLDAVEPDLVLYQGTINDCDGNIPQNITITITDESTQEIYGTYTPNSNTGNYVLILPPGTVYSVSIESDGYTLRTDTIVAKEKDSYYKIDRSITMVPIRLVTNPKGLNLPCPDKQELIAASNTKDKGKGKGKDKQKDIVNANIDPSLVLKEGETLKLNNIYFDFDKSSLREASIKELDKLIAILKSNPNAKVEFSAHTDSKGSDQYNMELSKRRAFAARNYIVNKGIAASRSKLETYGKSKPAVPNTNEDGSDNPENRQLNRRVEIVVIN
jgi:outer membrane protein OmpA-like peptidoglycan-associated protein/tetratricopeptide (TPR) repeat protein